MCFVGVNQSNDFEETMEIVSKYTRMGHHVEVRLVDFHEDSKEHNALEWEVRADFDPYLCFNCKRMKDSRVDPITKLDGENYCSDCAREIKGEIGG